MKTSRSFTKTISALIVLLAIVSCALRAAASLPERNSTLTVKDELDKAKKAGNAVFLVITAANASGVTSIVAIANEANKKVKKSTVIQMNKDDAANSDLVTKYGVSGVAVPFVLVISPKGIACGGYPASMATADALVNSIPSPKNDDALVSLNSKKPCFIVAYKKSFTDKAAAIANCKKATSKVSAGATIIEVDMDDAKESDFLTQIGVNLTSNTTVTVVINAAGNITGNYPGTTVVQTLADAANKVVKSCCPGGSSSGCGKK